MVVGFSGPVNLLFNIRFFLPGGPIFMEIMTGSFEDSSSASGAESSASSVASRFSSDAVEADFRAGDSDLDTAAFPRADFLLKESTVCLEARSRLGGRGEDERSDSCFSC